MKTTKMALILSLFLVFNAYSQDEKTIIYEYSEADLDVSEVDLTNVRMHPFGEEVTKKLIVFEDKYTYKEPASPTSPVEKTVVHKPIIYNSINKIDRKLKKQVKKGITEKEKAAEDLLKCLDVALICSNLNSSELESRIKEAKKLDPMIEVYKSVKLE